MKSIRPVKWFSHPLSKTPFPSEAEAQADYKKALASKRKAEQAQKLRDSVERDANWVRLNAESFEAVPEMMTQICKKHGITLKWKEWNMSRFRERRTSHAAPLGCKTDWEGKSACLAWDGHVEGQLSGGKDSFGRTGIGFSDLFSGSGSFYLKGFHGDSGSCGQQFSMGFYFFLDDFPKLKALHARALLFLKEQAEHADIEAASANQTLSKISTRNDVVTLRSSADALRRRLSELHQQIADTSKQLGIEVAALSAIETKEIEASRPILKSKFSDKERQAFKAFGSQFA